MIRIDKEASDNRARLEFEYESERPHKSLALKGAERKGREAALTGLPRSACPYSDKRMKYNNSVTFSRAFMKAWLKGWDEIENNTVA